MPSLVLHVSQPVTGGVARVVAQLAKDQLEYGWRVAVASPPDGQLAAWVQDVGGRHLSWRAGRAPGPAAAREIASLGRIINACNPAIVHLHSSKAGLAGRAWLRGCRPTVFQPHCWSFQAVHGLEKAAATAWERVASRWSDVIVCVSEAERRTGEEAAIHAGYRVVKNGVDLSVYSEASDEDRSAARRRSRLGGDPLAVCIGRLCRQKGQDLLVAAWPSVREKVPNAQLVLVGDGPDRAQLERQAGAGVQIVGDRNDVRDWLAAADVVAIPSRWEGMSLVMLEAMARSRSVVSTDVNGAHETLRTEAGALVPTDDVTRLAQTLTERLCDSRKAAAEGRAGRLLAQKFHDARQTSTSITRLYLEVLASNRRRKPSGTLRPRNNGPMHLKQRALAPLSVEEPAQSDAEML